MVSLFAVFLAVLPPIFGGSSVSDVLDKELSSAHQHISPSVVVVSVEKSPDYDTGSLPHDVEQLLKTPEGETVHMPADQGSGFAIDGEGHIITNKHVVDGAAPDGITVRLLDQREIPAKLLGVDPDTDIAVLKIPEKLIPGAEMFDSKRVKVGQIACAVGSPYRLQDTFSLGVISALGRNGFTGCADGVDYIQTDAPIHPGNSGGPLCDAHGRVFGVNTMINGVNRGLGFAVPINLAMDSAKRIITSGSILRPSIEVETTPLSQNPTMARYFSPQSSGLVVMALRRDSVAYASGLRPGDILISADSLLLQYPSDIQKALLNKKVGDSLKLSVIRSTRPLIVDIPLSDAQRLPLPPIVSIPPPPDVTVAPLGVVFSKGKAYLTVESVTQGSKASIANIQPGDVILAVESMPVKTGDDVQRALEAAPPSRGAMFLIERGGRMGFSVVK